jgi:hypothetical protein
LKGRKAAAGPAVGIEDPDAGSAAQRGTPRQRLHEPSIDSLAQADEGAELIAPPRRPEIPPYVGLHRGAERARDRHKPVVLDVVGAVGRHCDRRPAGGAHLIEHIASGGVARVELARPCDVALRQGRRTFPIQGLGETGQDFRIIGVALQRVTPQPLGAVEVAAPGDRPRAARERIGSVRREREDGVVQGLRPARLPVPRQHARMGNHRFGVERLDAPQPDEPGQRAHQIPVPAVEDREPVQRARVQRVAREHGIVQRAGGVEVTPPERVLGLRQLRRDGRGRAERDERRGPRESEPGDPASGWAPHHEPHRFCRAA